MADKVKSTKQLKLVAGFEDGDDRTISLDNPKTDITAEEINALEAGATAAIIGDKADAAFTGWKDARIVESEVVYLDLTTD